MFRFRILLAGLTLVAAGCGVSKPVANASPAAPHIKVLTYNVNWLCAKPTAVRDYLTSSGADVICLQETHPKWENELKRLAPTYPHSHFVDSNGAGGTAILSKYPLHDIKVLPGRKGWFPALTACADTPIGTVRFLNVHLHPPVSEKGSPTVSAYWSTPTLRLDEIKGFMDAIDEVYPVVVLGDFNDEPGSDAVKYVQGKGYANALKTFAPSANTWSWQVGVVTLNKCYDHILCHGKLLCTAAKVTSVRASDHEPVEAVLILKK